MAGKQKNTKKLKKRVTEKGKEAGKLEPPCQPPPPLFDRQRVKQLSTAIGIAAIKLGLSRDHAQKIHDRLFHPLRILTLLHHECEAVLHYDTRSAGRFLKKLIQLPVFRQNAEDILGELRRFASARHDCDKRLPRASLISFEAIAPLYQAAFIASGGDTKRMNEAFSQLARISHAEQTLERLNRTLTAGEQGAVNDQMAWGLAFARGPFCGDGLPATGPVIDPGGGSWEGSTESDPWGGGPEGDPWGGLPGGWEFPEIGGPCDEPAWPPAPDDDNLRLGCEGILIDAFNAEAPSLRLLGRRSAWADNIDSIELEGTCGGDWMIIQGQGFGDPQPDNIALIAHTSQGCRELEVEPDNWSTTEIRVQLPDNILSGPLGFYDKMATNAYNRWIGEMNTSAARILSAS
ncbi:MAG: hypothetical protein KZQ87_08120, partial [Candidatus Thiodiazotropha sp. (ex Cardiolucina cf. quadrata)]|nr:hypothetical protein [Candidatus Thiodiazotropha sp. (ex Cardiolucina cf. quadrata)]